MDYFLQRSLSVIVCKDLNGNQGLVCICLKSDVGRVLSRTQLCRDKVLQRFVGGIYMSSPNEIHFMHFLYSFDIALDCQSQDVAFSISADLPHL